MTVLIPIFAFFISISHETTRKNPPKKKTTETKIEKKKLE
jgi:hypothetical protein